MNAIYNKLTYYSPDMLEQNYLDECGIKKDDLDYATVFEGEVSIFVQKATRSHLMTFFFKKSPHVDGTSKTWVETFSGLKSAGEPIGFGGNANVLMMKNTEDSKVDCRNHLHAQNIANMSSRYLPPANCFRSRCSS